MGLKRIDHFELVVSDIERALTFYRGLGVETTQTENPAQGRKRSFLNLGGNQQVNIVTPEDVAALGRKALAGGGHLAMVWEGTAEEVLSQLSRNGLAPRRGPGRGFGALGEATSIFVNDPDSNSIEIIVYAPDT
jgi:catechol 2,3-dioxygenase-like lactoylglutathione lyase family enzyme